MSYEVNAYRIGEEANREGNRDPKLIALDKQLVSALSSATEPSVVGAVTLALTEAYGEQNVTSSLEGPEYQLIWNREKQKWEWLCIERTALLVNDGEPKLVRVQVSILTLLG